MKNYNVYMFNDGDVLASTKSINYFRKELGAKRVTSGLTEDKARQIEKMLCSNSTLYMIINNLIDEIDTLNMQVEMLENVIA